VPSVFCIRYVYLNKYVYTAYLDFRPRIIRFASVCGAGLNPATSSSSCAHSDAHSMSFCTKRVAQCQPPRRVASNPLGRAAARQGARTSRVSTGG
jgi:hypothetical protein